MHMQKTPLTMQDSPSYINAPIEIYDFLKDRVDDCISKGIERDMISIDPGIGFGKSLTHNLELLHSRSNSNYSILWGVSRKSMFGQLLGRTETVDRLSGTLAVAAHAMLEGVDILRVHDVQAHADLLTTLATLRPEVDA